MLQALEPLKGEKGEINLNKLPPPKIDNILPAFVEADNNNKVEILIPYELNMSIKDGDFDKVKYIIRSSTINKEIITGTVNIDRGQRKLILLLSKNLFVLGQYYSIQIAFVNESSVGYFSTVGTARYINKPTLSVAHTNLRDVIGTFSDELTNEKIYSYQFNLYNDFNDIIESSGIQIHNNINDNGIDSIKDFWEIQTTLMPDIKYKIQYSVNTTNNYYAQSDIVDISYYETIKPRIDSELLVENNYEDGYNRIYLERFSALGDEDRNICGNFFLLRSTDKDDYKKWEKLINFQIYDWTYANNKILEIYKDFFVEQGVSYRYAIQAYNDKGIYSTKVLNENGPIYVDFEHMFLYDGEYQLKIKFNPKMSSFKNTILENKVDTIGGQYPFFFRNNSINYKEFPISGLLSLASDEKEIFFSAVKEEEIMEQRRYTPETYWKEHNNKINLSGKNIYRERNFKLKVLEWLNNGQEKVFRSATEGNYIVRLMNVSLTPNDTLGRMLHTFQGTAYEVSEYNLINLRKLQFIDKSNKIERKEVTLSLEGKTSNINLNTEVIVDQAKIYTMPKLAIKYVLREDTSGNISANDFGICDLTSAINEKGLKQLKTNTWGKDSYLTYSYLNKVNNTQNWYWVESSTNPTTFTKTINGKGMGHFLKQDLNSNTEIVSGFPHITVSKREVILITQKSANSYVLSSDGKTSVKFSSGKLYYVENKKVYIEGSNSKKEIKDNASLFTIEFPEDFFNLKNDLKDNNSSRVFRNIEDFSLGQGLQATVIASKKTLTLANPSSTYTYAI